MTDVPLMNMGAVGLADRRVPGSPSGIFAAGETFSRRDG